MNRIIFKKTKNSAIIPEKDASGLTFFFLLPNVMDLVKAKHGFFWSCNLNQLSKLKKIKLKFKLNYQLNYEIK
jgi:hypothetical protein